MDPIAALQLALEHQQAGRLSQAEQLYRQVLQADPANVDALHLLGVIATRVGKHETAVQLITRAIALEREHPTFYVNLAEAYLKWGRPDEALAASRQAIAVDPNFADAHNMLAVTLSSQHRFDEALASYARAIELAPDYAEAHYNRAMAWLCMGDYARGWAEHEWRLRQTDYHQPPMPQPRWDGTPLAGRTLLVQCEQGLGDTLQFIRYVQLLASQGQKVLVRPQAALVKLLAASGVRNIVAPGDALPAFDVYALLMSLPYLLKTSLQTIPARVPYLSADRQLAADWKARLRALGGFCVGICWQGNPNSPHEPRRSMSLANFQRLALPGVTLVSLQKGLGAQQIPQVADQFRVHDFSAELDEANGPFMDTAAIVAGLDLVITSDTAIAHLAGALGRRVWVALAHPADWRWMHDRRDSPWYPTMRLFRQSAPGDWSNVFEEMAGELSAIVGR